MKHFLCTGYRIRQSPTNPEKINPHPGEDISHAPIILYPDMYVRPTAIYAYINCKTTRDSRSLHSDLLIESFHVQHPSRGLSLLGVGVIVIKEGEK